MYKDMRSIGYDAGFADGYRHGSKDARHHDHTCLETKLREIEVLVDHWRRIGAQLRAEEAHETAAFADGIATAYADVLERLASTPSPDAS